MRIIGLTGGIATGKSTVSNYLSSKYKLPVLDADIYAREAVEKGSPILQDIFTRFGSHLQLPDGSLDRSALGNIVFSNPEAKQWLESKIHPYVRDRFSGELAKITDNTVVLAIPLLFEANLTHLVTEIWVVSCDEEIQLARLQQRNNLTAEGDGAFKDLNQVQVTAPRQPQAHGMRDASRIPSPFKGGERLTLEQAKNRINSQLPLKEKIAQADLVLTNNTTREHLYQQCDEILFAAYSSL